MEEEWRRKGATLSDKTARKEFGLTQHEIEAAIDAGQLQFRVGVVHGNPWLRLLRRELEALMESTYNDRDHRHRRAKAELVQVERDLKRLRAEVAALEEYRSKLLADMREWHRWAPTCPISAADRWSVDRPVSPAPGPRESGAVLQPTAESAADVVRLRRRARRRRHTRPRTVR